MEFCNKDKELANLKEIEELSHYLAKTSLVKKAYSKRGYLFVSKKNEALLCEEFIETISMALNSNIHEEFRSFGKFFANSLKWEMAMCSDHPSDKLQTATKLAAACLSPQAKTNPDRNHLHTTLSTAHALHALDHLWPL